MPRRTAVTRVPGGCSAELSADLSCRRFCIESTKPLLSHVPQIVVHFLALQPDRGGRADHRSDDPKASSGSVHFVRRHFRHHFRLPFRKPGLKRTTKHRMRFDQDLPRRSNSPRLVCESDESNIWRIKKPMQTRTLRVHARCSTLPNSSQRCNASHSCHGWAAAPAYARTLPWHLSKPPPHRHSFFHHHHSHSLSPPHPLQPSRQQGNAYFQHIHPLIE